MGKFTQGYIECALWASTYEVGDENVPLERDFYLSDLSPCALKQMQEDCEDFQKAQEELLNLYYEERGEAYAGHDFWLTRNGHGAGFWDRGLGRVGVRLSEEARVYGSADLYPGDDGKLYHS